MYTINSIVDLVILHYLKCYFIGADTADAFVKNVRHLAISFSQNRTYFQTMEMQNVCFRPALGFEFRNMLSVWEGSANLVDCFVYSIQHRNCCIEQTLF